MHCEDGTERVNACLIGCPGSLRGIVGSALCDVPVLPNAAIRPGMRRVAIVGVDRVASRAPRRAIVARLLVGAHEPHVRVVQPRLGDVDHRHRDAKPGAGAAIGLPDVGPAGLVELLDRAGVVRQSDFRKLAHDHPAAALEDAEDVGDRNGLPRRKREQLRQNSPLGHERRGRNGIDQRRRLSLGGIRFADDVALERQDPVVVGSPAPKHGRGRHHASLGRLNDGQVARAAGVARHAIVPGIDEAHEFRRLAIEQGVGALGSRARREVPRLGEPRQHVRAVGGSPVARVLRPRCLRLDDLGVAAVAIGAAENHAGVDVHRGVIGRRMTTDAAERFGQRVLRCLPLRRGRRRRIGARHSLLDVHAECARRGEHHQRAHHREHRSNRGVVARVHDK